MNEVIVLSANPGQPWWILFIPAAIFIASAVMAIVASVWYDDEYALGFFLVGLLDSMVTAIIMIYTMSAASSNDTDDRIMYKLREIGYSQIELDDPITAVKDGEYVRLTLEPVPDEERTYQVIEIPPVP